MNYDITLLQGEEIKSFRRAYLNALENNWKTLEGNEDRDSWKRNFETWIRESFTIFLLRIENNIVGYISGDPTRILHIWVQAKFRDNHFGQELVNKFLKCQKAKGFSKFTLKAYDKNVDFFRSLGATVQTDCSDFKILKFNNS